MSLTVMKYIQDGAVLRCGEPFPIYGTAAPSAGVTLRLTRGGDEVVCVSGTAGSDGRYCVSLPAVGGGFDSYELTIESGDESLRFSDILFGEVFHITGQSNMELPVKRTYHPFKPFEHRESSFIREFRVPVKCCFDPDAEQEDFSEGYWLRAQGDQLLDMSAAGYYFALELMDRLNVPVGLLNTASGGSAVESRMPAEMLREIGGYEERLAEYADPDFMAKRSEKDGRAMQEWYRKLGELDRVRETVFTERFAADGKCCVPFYFRDMPELKGFSGRVWLRKRFCVPEGTELSGAELILGNIIDSNRAYINGEKVGETGYMYPPRYYRFDGGLLRHGENTVAVCMEAQSGNGAFVPGKDYCLKVGGEVIDLSGEWEYAAIRTERLTPGLFFPELPMSHYATMTAPSFRINVSGMLWYQGETNAWHPERYFGLFSRYIGMVRERCGKELPVVIAQLPNYAGHGEKVGTGWAVLRLEQERCTELGNCAVTVNIGCGESNDLHPIDKKTIGERLAWTALDLIYGKPVKSYSRCVSAEYSEGKVTLGFDGPEIELMNEPALYFEAVTDGAVRRLTAKKVSAHAVELECVERPEQIRYAFTDDPAKPDLFNAEGLPVPPFVRKI